MFRWSLRDASHLLAVLALLTALAVKKTTLRGPATEGGRGKRRTVVVGVTGAGGAAGPVPAADPGVPGGVWGPAPLRDPRREGGVRGQHTPLPPPKTHGDKTAKGGGDGASLQPTACTGGVNFETPNPPVPGATSSCPILNKKTHDPSLCHDSEQSVSGTGRASVLPTHPHPSDAMVFPAPGVESLDPGPWGWIAATSERPPTGSGIGGGPLAMGGVERGPGWGPVRQITADRGVGPCAGSENLSGVKTRTCHPPPARHI